MSHRDRPAPLAGAPERDNVGSSGVSGAIGVFWLLVLVLWCPWCILVVGILVIGISVYFGCRCIGVCWRVLAVGVVWLLLVYWCVLVYWCILV